MSACTHVMGGEVGVWAARRAGWARPHPSRACQSLRRTFPRAAAGPAPPLTPPAWVSAAGADPGCLLRRAASRGRESPRVPREPPPPRPVSCGAPPHPRGWRAAPEAPARPAIPRWPALASCSNFAFYSPPRPCLLSQWRCGLKEMEEKERCDQFRSVLLH